MKIDHEQKALLNDDEGLSTVEYIIILILIAIIGIVAWRAFGNAVRTQASSATGQISSLETGGGS
ncbi:MAG: Flp family type IVb pilin [Myxococcota bacterium]